VFRVLIHEYQHKQGAATATTLRTFAATDAPDEVWRRLQASGGATITWVTDYAPDGLAPQLGPLIAQTVASMARPWIADLRP
jgi:hypothetical protein